MIEIRMPRLSDTMTEGAISQWHKAPGDLVAVGDILLDVETDKAVMEHEAYHAGTLSTILVEEGQTADIGTVIALLDDGRPGEANPGTSVSQTRRPSSPLVRKIARQHGIDLSTITGTGPGGRIIRKDVMPVIEQLPTPDSSDAPRSAAPPTSATADPGRQPIEVPLSNMRQVIARRLSDSAQTVPHFYVTAMANAEQLAALRGQLNEQLAATGRTPVSINDLLVRACALALRDHSDLNASYVDEPTPHVLIHQRVSIGIAVATDAGLMVPVIPDADQKTVSQIAHESRELIKQAQARKLSPAQMSGATFTISNLGMYGVEQFTAIINPPEAGILAVGALRPEPTIVDEVVLLQHQLRYTLSADHRIIDGAGAATFLTTLTRLVENPWSILA